MRVLPVAVAVGAAWLAAGGGPGLAAAPPPDIQVRARVDVEEVVVDALVVDGGGNPIPDLSVTDFVVLADGRPVVLTGAEWVAPGRAEVELEPPVEGAPRFPEGRLLVFFFQTDFTRARLKGQMEIANEAVRLLKGLLPTDRVAVLSFDSHLKLWLDFTADRERIRQAIFRTFRIGPAPALPPGPVPSIAERFDAAAAARAATVEKGLALTALALEPIPGAKQLLYFGWGLGVNHSPAETRDFAFALGCFRLARISAFALDVTQADAHTLEGNLIAFAELTGGTYQKTFYFPAGALDLVLRGTRGRYLVSFRRPPGPRGVHGLEIRLAARAGTVHARPTFED